MKNELRILILDVGHGNSAFVISPKSTVLIDCAPGIVLPEAIEEYGITEIHGK